MTILPCVMSVVDNDPNLTRKMIDWTT